MNLIRATAIAASLIAAAFVGASIQKSGVLQVNKTEYLKLSEPLLLSAGGQSTYFHVLPAGAALYKEQSFPEGFDRYRVYINIKGAFASERVVSDKPNLIDPMWASTVKKDDIQALMGETPVSKDDLVRILKARKISREELAQILRDWQE